MNKQVKVIDNSPQIRAASLEDLNSILAVERNAFPPDRQASLDTLQKRLQLFLQGCLVAEQNEELVGFETSLITRDIISIMELDQPDEVIHDPAGIVYYLRSLAIKQKFQRRGIGKALTEEAIKLARTFNKQIFRFTATRDIEDFYTKLGFKRISEYKNFHGLPQAIWELKL